MASQSTEALLDRSRRDAGQGGISDEASDTSPVPQSLEEQLVSIRAEADRYREQADERAAELGELRALLGEAELRRGETLRLLRRLRAQERLIAELRPRAASNKLALQALRRLKSEARTAGRPDEPKIAGAPSPNLWSRSIGRLLRKKPGHGKT